jgi:hypothetical protein
VARYANRFARREAVVMEIQAHHFNL